jgi:hypothetical protein
MTVYNFNLDAEHLEIFPTEVWQDPFVVYHGTTSIHSNNIEANGFIKGVSPFNLEQAKELISVLESAAVKPFDTPSVIGMTQAQTLKDYINAIERGYFRLSFSYLSYQCVLFASGPSKGGQTFGTVRKAKEVIEQAISANAIDSSTITEPITELFRLSNIAADSGSLVYAVKLPNDLKNIKLEYNVIYSSDNIPANQIIGKVCIPDNFDLNTIDRKNINTKLMSKLYKPKNIGAILNKLSF